ncbi:MAG: hypothetical protein LBV67_09665 [Streptococcaceae bacterium]|jgi:ABC-type Fe3+-hydroxamate transport system substrate-binding protein|nr:hypothetical protein [Streptococcaceae bacterium]
METKKQMQQAILTTALLFTSVAVASKVIDFFESRKKSTKVDFRVVKDKRTTGYYWLEKKQGKYWMLADSEDADKIFFDNEQEARIALDTVRSGKYYNKKQVMDW